MNVELLRFPDYFLLLQRFMYNIFKLTIIAIPYRRTNLYVEILKTLFRASQADLTLPANSGNDMCLCKIFGI